MIKLMCRLRVRWNIESKCNQVFFLEMRLLYNYENIINSIREIYSPFVISNIIFGRLIFNYQNLLKFCVILKTNYWNFELIFTFYILSLFRNERNI